MSKDGPMPYLVGVDVMEKMRKGPLKHLTAEVVGDNSFSGRKSWLHQEVYE